VSIANGEKMAVVAAEALLALLFIFQPLPTLTASSRIHFLSFTFSPPIIHLAEEGKEKKRRLRRLRGGRGRSL